jgi:stress response protein SCP2
MAPPAVVPSAAPVVPSGPPQVLRRGERIDLASMGLTGGPFEIAFSAPGNAAPFDMVCFGLDANDCVPSEPYFIFFGQMASPCGGLELLGASNDEHRLRVNTTKLPLAIQKVVVAAFVDGAGHFDQATAIVKFDQSGQAGARLELPAGEFNQHRGVALAEIYLRQGKWRLFVRAEGQTGDLTAFATQHGVTVT